MNFVAIDFETANSSRSSACSVAVVTVENSKIVDSFYSLIKPSNLKFDYWNTRIHGITAEDVLNQPTFADIWDKLKPYLHNKTVIAHNAAFDISVLRSVITEYGLTAPLFNHFCTVSMSKKVWPDSENFKLSTLAKRFDISFEHHNALDDARVCATLALLAQDQVKAQNLDTLIAKLEMKVKAFKTA
ncbi:3'-5' exonuclease [Dendrosporobacter sp. 1207_IL3150]|uniref:3'-5' exonuclease n=1 Tax=Dendrosporobacter sp. 1207_IL3150 TaxID=3084054 RepID=UPI002FDB1F06